jgi:hypothetical protein
MSEGSASILDLEGTPIDALFAPGGINLNPEVEFREWLTEAEVIIGIDVMSRHRFLVYGRDALEEVVRSGEPREMDVFAVELDRETDELERLCALAEVVKGRCDYRGASSHPAAAI